MELTMVNSKRMPEPMFFATPQLAKDSVVMSCSKLTLHDLRHEFPNTYYTYKNSEGMIHEIITVTQIMDSQILDRVEHI